MTSVRTALRAAQLLHRQPPRLAPVARLGPVPAQRGIVFDGPEKPPPEITGACAEVDFGAFVLLEAGVLRSALTA